MGIAAKGASMTLGPFALCALCALSPAHALAESRGCIETPLVAALRPARVVAWADKLAPIEVESPAKSGVASIRLYGSDGEVDPAALEAFERAATQPDDDVHPLAARLVQLVFKAAYHFGGRRVVVVSGFRPHASKHGTNEALDFKLKGVRASILAAYLRGMPRAGVGIYTHPRTQYVHLDVREPSFHWIDASPPGVHWREGTLWDKNAAKRDAAWTPEMDLP
ncbi:MAG: D-Ala-D-Ala carboxypeptidase family metallohydrolase [Polyangiaceae bacterium]